MTREPSSVVFEHVLFFGRKFDEVLTLFHLTEDDLAGQSVLDCNSGPDAFVGHANRRGFQATGCDPLYAKSLDDLRADGLADIAHSLERSRGHEETTGPLDIDAFNSLKVEALETFLSDFEEGKDKGWYVPGALPQLPFADQSFDLVLSAHFLFIASHPRFGGMIETEEFDLEFHRRSLRELLRVARIEVRIFPITQIGHPTLLHPWVPILLGELSADGLEIAIEENTYDQGQFTGHHVAVIRR